MIARLLVLSVGGLAVLGVGVVPPLPSIHAHHCGPDEPFPERPRHSCRTLTESWHPGEPVNRHPGGAPGRRPAPQPYPSASQAAPHGPGPGPHPGPAVVDISTDLTQLTAYWTAQFRQQGLTFTPPAAVITPGALGYDPNTQTIEYDPVLISDLSAAAGPFAVSAVLAHEMAHHVQYLRGRYTWLSVGGAKGREVDADRLTGAYLRWAHGRGLVSIDELRIALVTFFNGADSLPEFDPNRHGSAETRVRMVLNGYFQGPTPQWWRTPLGRIAPG